MRTRITELVPKITDAKHLALARYRVVCAPGMPYRGARRSMGSMMADHLTVPKEKIVVNETDLWVWTTLAECLWAVRWARHEFPHDKITFYVLSSPAHNRRVQKLFLLFPELRGCNVQYLSSSDEPTKRWQEWVSYGKLYFVYGLAWLTNQDPARLSSRLFRAPAIRGTRSRTATTLLRNAVLRLRFWGAR
jgi:hypothetical protein